MPGGLLQLVATGAQNELVNGSPSMTHFRAVYRRHTNFAMEQIRMPFTSSNLEFNVTQTRTFSCRIDRYTNLLHDCYLVLTMPDIWSPLKYLGAGVSPPAGYNSKCTAIGYEFQWIDNLGYNMIDHIDLVMNGQVIQSLRGEWLKLYSYMTHTADKRAIVDEMTGNVAVMNDPANAYDRVNQYPHAITGTSGAVALAALPLPKTNTAEPSIRARQLMIPLHFWFCENPGLALPLTALQNSEVYINVTLRALNDLYTVIDVNPSAASVALSGATSTGSTITYTTATANNLSAGQTVTITGFSDSTFNVTAIINTVSTSTFTVTAVATVTTLTQSATATGATNPTYGKRVAPVNYPMSLFLSPPLSTGLPSNPSLTAFIPDFYLEGTFIYLTEMEMNQLARADQTFLIKTVRYVNKEGQFGGNTDLELPMFNLVSRIVFASQRSDRMLVNDWDNYTNWDSPNRAPWTRINTDIPTSLYSSGQQQITAIAPRSNVIDGLILFDGKERIATKPFPFFSLQQMYRHVTGQPAATLPGVYQYSFALDHDQYQPSGAANGSMFNKTILRLTLQTPVPLSVTTSGATSSIVCVLRSTVFSNNPTIIPAGQVNALNPDGSRLYDPSEIVSVVQTNDNVIFSFTYNVGVYVESINFLRIVSGLGNLVFAS
jgi:hypothetical protein